MITDKGLEEALEYDRAVAWEEEKERIQAEEAKSSDDKETPESERKSILESLVVGSISPASYRS